MSEKYALSLRGWVLKESEEKQTQNKTRRKVNTREEISEVEYKTYIYICVCVSLTYFILCFVFSFSSLPFHLCLQHDLSLSSDNKSFLFISKLFHIYCRRLLGKFRNVHDIFLSTAFSKVKNSCGRLFRLFITVFK